MNIERLEKLEKQSIDFILSVRGSYDSELYSGNSGGKDSAIIDYLLRKSGIKYNSIYTNTTIDPTGTIGYIRRNYPHTKILQPTMSFYQLVAKKGLPTRLNRYCCERLKEYGSVGKIIFEGVRSAESSKRKGRDYIQCDSRKWQKGAQHAYPIYDWTDEDVWDFIEFRQIKLAPHYSNGGCRLGCVACPLVTRKGVRQGELDLYPKFYYAIKKAITIGMQNNPQWKLTCATNGNGRLAMEWWLSGLTIDQFFSDYKFEVAKEEHTNKKGETKMKKVGWIKTKKI